MLIPTFLERRFIENCVEYVAIISSAIENISKSILTFNESNQPSLDAIMLLSTSALGCRMSEDVHTISPSPVRVDTVRTSLQVSTARDPPGPRQSSQVTCRHTGLTRDMDNRVGVSNEGFEDDRFNNIELKENKRSDNIQEESQIDDCGSCLNLKAFNKLRSPKWFLLFLSLGACMQDGKIYYGGKEGRGFSF